MQNQSLLAESYEREGNPEGKKATYGDLLEEIEDDGKEDDEYAESSGEESFYEITTSEPESLSSSDENNAENLEMVLHSAYTCSLHKYRCNPVIRNSLLLRDKDLLDSNEGMYPVLRRYLHNYIL